MWCAVGWRWQKSSEGLFLSDQRWQLLQLDHVCESCLLPYLTLPDMTLPYLVRDNTLMGGSADDIFDVLFYRI